MMPTICRETVVIISVMFLQHSGQRLGGCHPATARPRSLLGFGRPLPLQQPLRSLARGAGAAPTLQEKPFVPQSYGFSPRPPLARAQRRTLPFCLRPEEIGTQHDGHVARRHFVHVLVLSQLGQEFDQVPGGASPGAGEAGCALPTPTAAPRPPHAHLMLL